MAMTEEKSRSKSKPGSLRSFLAFHRRLSVKHRGATMPKASKKRKEKAADFAKAKLKLGKGKQLPSNAIDTSFKARCALSGALRMLTLMSALLSRSYRSTLADHLCREGRGGSKHKTEAHIR
jgi:hypothetical protein